jgi:hypothetical protein
MSDTENLGSFLKETKKLVKDYVDTRLEIYRLMVIRAASGAAGYLLWTIVLMGLLFLLVIFLGLVTGFWLSEKTGSYTSGFGIATGLLLLVIILVAAFRKPLFVNPIIRNMIKKLDNNTKEQNEN